MPDLEAIEVAQSALSDVEDASEALADEGKKVEQSEDEAADELAEGEGEESEKESKSQRRRRLRREKEQQATQRMWQLEQENSRLRERAGTLRQPNPQHYSSEAEYAADLAAYRVRKQDVQAEDERIQGGYSEAASTEAAAFDEAVADFKAEGAEKYKDFVQVLERNDISISPVMAEAIMESDMGVDVAYYLGKRPKEAARIAALSPVAQARAIFALEAKVQAELAPPKSQAPAPVKPIRGGSAAPAKPVSQMSMAEYAAYRQKQIAGER